MITDIETQMAETLQICFLVDTPPAVCFADWIYEIKNYVNLHQTRKCLLSSRIYILKLSSCLEMIKCLTKMCYIFLFAFLDYNLSV